MEVKTEYVKPKWLAVFTDAVRPGGIALMFFFITVLPLFFAIIDLGFKGVGIRLASVLSSYFQAIPDTYYTTIQVLFVGYAVSKSSEIVADKIRNRPVVNVPSQNTTVNAEGGDNIDGPKG